MSIRVLRTEKCKFFKENDKPGFNFNRLCIAILK